MTDVKKIVVTIPVVGAVGTINSEQKLLATATTDNGTGAFEPHGQNVAIVPASFTLASRANEMFDANGTAPNNRFTEVTGDRDGNVSAHSITPIQRLMKVATTRASFYLLV